MTNAETTKNTVNTNRLSGGLVWLFVAAFLIVAFIFIGSSLPTLNKLFVTYNFAESTQPQTELYFTPAGVQAGRNGNLQFAVKNRENKSIVYTYRVIQSDPAGNQRKVLNTGDFTLTNNQQKQVSYELDADSLREKYKITVELSFVRPASAFSESKEITQTIHLLIDGERI